MKKIYLFIVFTFVCIFIFNCNVKAQDIYTTTFNKSDYIDGMATINMGGIWKNKGRGYLLFSVSAYYVGGTTNIPSPTLMGAYADSNIGNTCEVGNMQSYSDNTSQIMVYTVKCPIELTSQGLQAVYLDFDPPSNGVSWKYQTSYNISLVKNDSGVDLTSVIQAINALDNHDLLQSFYNLVSYGFAELNSNNANNTYSIRQSIEQHRILVIEALQSLSTSQINAINSNTQAVQDQTDTIKSENTSGAESSATDLVNNSDFQDNTGLTGIISMPLTFVNNLGSTCQPISLTIPYMDYTFTIPCLQSIVNQYMPALVVVLKVIVNGLIIYWVMLDIFHIVKSAKNPEDDRIEVLDL